MSIETYYVKAKSKKELNEALASGLAVHFENHSIMASKLKHAPHELKQGDVIKIYENKIGGSPHAKAYGNWDAKKGRVK